LLLWVTLSVSASEFDDLKVLAEQGDVDTQRELAYACVWHWQWYLS
jgi:hypothetical protein